MNFDKQPTSDRLFQAALAHPPEDREAFAREAAGDDENLFAEVKALLNAWDEAGGDDADDTVIEDSARSAFASVAVEEPGTLSCGSCGAEVVRDDLVAGLCPKCVLIVGPGVRAPKTFVPPSPEALQVALPQFEIMDLLPRGGMGAVYRAKQRKLDRLVAIKILPPELGDDAQFRERFDREARALAKLSHPHIVGIYDFDEREDFCYLVMEFVDGVNLAQLLRSGNLASDQALAIVPQICEALQFAHDQGIVHRDIKPGNILVTKSGDVKIADFGLAKLVGESSDASDMLTMSNQVLGTPNYMAPEQRNAPDKADHRADIYSLGVVFYEMLTGELPQGVFPPPSKKGEVDASIDDVVLRALESEPELRYQHASDIRTDVEAVTGRHQRVTVSPTAAGDRADDRTADLPGPTDETVVSPKTGGEEREEKLDQPENMGKGELVAVLTTGATIGIVAVVLWYSLTTDWKAGGVFGVGSRTRDDAKQEPAPAFGDAEGILTGTVSGINWPGRPEVTEISVDVKDSIATGGTELMLTKTESDAQIFIRWKATGKAEAANLEKTLAASSTEVSSVGGANEGIQTGDEVLITSATDKDGGEKVTNYVYRSSTPDKREFVATFSFVGG